MPKQKRLTAEQIAAAQLALAHAEADAQCGGDWDEERSATLERGCKILATLLNAAIAKAEGRAE